MKRWLWLCGIGLLGLCGCGKFFVPQNTTGTGTTTTNTGAGDVLYVANTATSTISAYLVSSTGTLTEVSGSPYTLPSPPVSMAVTPGNTFLYVGVATGILGYSIGTNGVLTELNSGTALVSDVLAPTAMAVDSTGGTLLAAGIDLSSGSNEFEVGGYGIDATTGALTAGTGYPLPVDTGNTSTTAGPIQLYFTPNNELVYLTLGNGGTEILTFASGGGLTDTGTKIDLTTNGTSQNGVVANSASSLLFLSETGAGIRVFTIGTNGAPTEISGSPFKAGTGPTGIVLNPAGTDLYVANKGDGTIGGFSVASTGTLGALTALGSSPYTAGTLPYSLTLDQSGNYLAVANEGGTPDLGVYSFDTTTAGKLDAGATETFGSSPAASFLVVSTHPSS
jgi:6-phosphogluconolactonase (cycloisomerase 2 family)